MPLEYSPLSRHSQTWQMEPVINKCSDKSMEVYGVASRPLTMRDRTTGQQTDIRGQLQLNSWVACQQQTCILSFCPFTYCFIETFSGVGFATIKIARKLREKNSANC